MGATTRRSGKVRVCIVPLERVHVLKCMVVLRRVQALESAECKAGEG